MKRFATADFTVSYLDLLPHMPPVRRRQLSFEMMALTVATCKGHLVQAATPIRPERQDSEVGKPRLDALDNDLARQFEQIEISKGASGDIVDTRDFNEDICSILTGGVSSGVDST